MILSGKSLSKTCCPAGEIVQPLGSTKPLSVGPTERGLSSANKGNANGANSATLKATARRSMAAVSRSVGVVHTEQSHSASPAKECPAARAARPTAADRSQPCSENEEIFLTMPCG